MLQANVRRREDGKGYVVVGREGEEEEVGERGLRVGQRVMGFTRYCQGLDQIAEGCILGVTRSQLKFDG